jgi:Mn2+/Fe2+ NRAMP family transporter
MTRIDLLMAIVSAGIAAVAFYASGRPSRLSASSRVANAIQERFGTLALRILLVLFGGFMLFVAWRLVTIGTKTTDAESRGSGVDVRSEFSGQGRAPESA